MKKYALILILLVVSVNCFAARKRGDYFNRPQIGLWIGPTAPLFELGDEVDSVLSGGVYARMSTFYKPIKIGLDVSYHDLSSDTVNNLTIVPAYGTVQYRLPFSTPLNLVVKAGGGVTKVWIDPDELEQWDPTGVAGFEVSFPLGKTINLGLRMDYLLIYEKHIESAEINGHVFNFALALFFNI